MHPIEQLAPQGDTLVDYDRRHLALYAALLDAADAHGDWQDTASTLMGLDVAEGDAEACWRSHVERARWIVGEGMNCALAAFSRRMDE